MALVCQDTTTIDIITLEYLLEEVVGEIYDEDADGMVKKIWTQRIGTRRH